MATNNSANIKDAGIISYNGSGTFSSLANPLTVANGGTGFNTKNAFTPLCGGTTSTNPIQSLSSNGSSGQILTSNGAGSLPSFQTQIAPAYAFIFLSEAGNPGDGNTYYLGNNLGAFTVVSTSTLTQIRYYIARNSTLNSFYGAIYVDGTLGSANNCTLAIRVNDTTDTNLTTTLQLTSATNTLAFTSIGLSLSAGDYFTLKFVGPTWTTNPTTVHIAASAYLS